MLSLFPVSFPAPFLALGPGKVSLSLHPYFVQSVLTIYTWSPFAVEIVSEQEWQQPWQTARSELRGFMAAEAARQQGAEAFRRFHQQLEQAVHETYLELGDESTLINAAVQAGLDMEQFQAVLRSDSLARAAQQSHQRGGKDFNVFGTPTLVFCGSHSVYLELGQLMADNNTLSLFQMVKAFALEQPQVVQLKRTTSSQNSS